VVHKNDLAGFGGGGAVEGKATMSCQVLDHGFGSGRGIGFTIGQTVIQIELPMPLEELPARILDRSYRPFLPSPMAFPNLPLDIFNDLVMVDWQGYGLYSES
jgi:hypothetical protein